MRVDEAIYLLAGYGANINPNNPVAEAVKMGIEALEGLLSAQPERKKGRWKYIAFMTVECSECHKQLHELEYDNFCPSCGADMRGEQE